MIEAQDLPTNKNEFTKFVLAGSLNGNIGSISAGWWVHQNFRWLPIKQVNWAGNGYFTFMLDSSPRLFTGWLPEEDTESLIRNINRGIL